MDVGEFADIDVVVPAKMQGWITGSWQQLLKLRLAFLAPMGAPIGKETPKLPL